MIHKHSFHGVPVKTGDILFTRDGAPDSVFGQIWRMLGNLMQTEFNHCAIYLGPGVRFIESAAKGVVVVEMDGDEWNAEPYGLERLLVDQLIGVGDPTAGRGLSAVEQTRMRERAVAFCLAQVAQGKPYNIAFLNPETTGAFYCSQLVYKAYQGEGINLHPHVAGETVSPLASLVFPQEVWNACLKKTRVPETTGAQP